MTNEEAIEVLKAHKAHWERLLDNGICDVLEGGNTIQALKVAIRALKNEQSDGDTEKTAEWVAYTEECGRLYQCSNCLYSYEEKTKYCPNCGAIMKGVE